MTTSVVHPLAHGDSVIHRIDPRVRLLCVLAASVCIAATSRPGPLLAACALAAVLVLVARIPWRPLWRRLRVLNAFMAIVLLTVPFSMQGETIWQAGALGASREGLAQALRIILTGNTLVLLLTSLVATIEPTVLAHALLHLRVPDKLVRILMFAVRYIDVLNDSRLRMDRAMKARGYVARCNAHTVRTSAYLVACLLAQSLDRAARIEWAMRCRGWRGQFPVLNHFHAGARDVRFACLFAGALAAAMVMP